MSPVGGGPEDSGPRGNAVASRGGGLEVELSLGMGALDLDVGFSVDPGQVVGLLGPNGAGKSTLLHAVAGLRRPDRGRIALAGRTLADAGAGVHRPPAERSVGLVFQDYLLFPHLTARENVAFGPRARGAPPAEAARRADAWLSRLHAEEVAGRRPADLSGGEAQRVALARALATEPDVLLLDEPLSALDAQARLDIRRELTAVLADFRGPVILVTHDPLEAAGLADRLLILQEGRVTQEGTVEEVTRRPRSPWVARLLGLNFFRGRGREVELEDGTVVRVGEPAVGSVVGVFEPADVRVEAGVEEGVQGEAAVPGFVEAREGAEAGGAWNRWSARVRGVETLGRSFRLHLEGPIRLVAETTLTEERVMALSRRSEVRVRVDPSRIRIFPAEGPDA